MTGYGIVEMEANQTHRIASGVVNVPALPMPQRLKIIFDEIGAVVREFQPDRMAVEQVFVSRNFDSAIKLSHARAAAICAGVTASLDIDEYTPRQIKQAIVGSGAADKSQVQHMVRILTGYKDPMLEDESDALAVALCHCHTSQTLHHLPHATGFRAGRHR